MSKKTFTVLLTLIILVNFTSLFSDIFMIDSSLYAMISKQFCISGNYIDIYVNGLEWLDKPHFPFWVCALSMKVFGINSFAYKLPSLLFFLIALRYTYKLSEKLYDLEIAKISTLILGSAFHIILSNNDVRAEAILLGLIAPALYYLYLYSLQASLKNILLSALFGAAAVMTKGIFVLVIFYSALFLNLWVQKEYSKLFSWKWIFVLVLTLVFTFPEIYAVYSQFDLHPEKVVFGKTGVSGVKFFLWDSQFGRFFNTGPIKGNGDVFFFTHTLLWAFAPWALLGFAALGDSIKTIIKKESQQEYFTFFGFIVMFLVFSVSKFQLAHYTNILFPMLAILTAVFIQQSKKNWIKNLLKYSIYFYTFLFALLVFILQWYFKPENAFIGWMVFASYLLLVIWNYFSKKDTFYTPLVTGLFASLLFALFFNLSFYPSLSKYQSGAQIAYYTNKHFPSTEIGVTEHDWLLQFYSKNKLIFIEDANQIASATPKLCVVKAELFSQLQKLPLQLKIVKTFEGYHITKLHFNFINHKTRKNVTQKYHLIQLSTKN